MFFPMYFSKTSDVAGVLRTLRIINGAYVGGVLIYLVFAYLLLNQEVMPRGGFIGPFPELKLLRAACWAVAAGCVVGILVIRTRWLTPEALRRSPKAMEQSIPMRYNLMFGLADTIADPGIILFLIAGFLWDLLILAGLALGLLFWIRPTKEGYHALLRQARGT